MNAVRPTKITGRIVQRGMGGFLCPPLHPEHTHHVQTHLEQRHANRGGMSLTAAAECDELDELVRETAKYLLAMWSRNRPPLKAVAVREWVREVLGYFRNCYRNPKLAGEVAWHAQHLDIDPKRDALTHAADHAGVHHVRKYYPEYEPKAEDFALARWGK